MRRFALVVCGLFAVASASAQTGDDFYRGKTITITVGSDAGAGYDAYARLLGRHMGRHIPGNPNVIVQNQPGAGSVTMTNAVANVGAKDGTAIGAPQSSVAFERLLHLLAPGGRNANFDATKLNWLGTASQDTFVVLGWHKSLVKTTQDMMTKEFVIGTSGPNTDGSLIVAVMNKLLGTKIKLITGYNGTAPQLLALERGEIDGASMAYGTVLTLRPNLHRDKEIPVLLQVGREKHRDLPDVAFLNDLMRNPDDRAVMSVIFDKYQMGRPYFVPAGVPPERVALLRKAFDDSLKDPALIAEAGQLKLELDPLPGTEVQKLIERLYATPEPLVKQARILLGPEK